MRIAELDMIIQEAKPQQVLISCNSFLSEIEGFQGEAGLIRLRSSRSTRMHKSRQSA